MLHKRLTLDILFILLTFLKKTAGKHIAVCEISSLTFSNFIHNYGNILLFFVFIQQFRQF